MAVEAIAETAEDENAWNGPPRAALARRAQSYSDFYNVASIRDPEEHGLMRQSSLDVFGLVDENTEPELAFDSQCAGLEDDLLRSNQEQYREHHERLRMSSSHLSALVMSTSSALDILASLSDSFRSVQTQTNIFRQQCESLLAEQRRLTKVADAIEENSRYYAYLEPITRRLNAPGATNLVKGSDFPEMLSNLDNCLEYMELHPKHKESATYRNRYRLLLTRALTLIRHHFTKSLGDIAADISKRIQSGQLKEMTHSALMHAKFRVPAPELKALGLEIQKRAVPTPDDVDAGREPEYASLLRELYQSYSTTRGRLILPMVSRKMAELDAASQTADVLTFAQASLSFLRGVCLDEYDLWFEWFETEGALYDFLDSLMEPLLDYLRPKIIHETRLEKLCELCQVLQARYMTWDSDDDEEDAMSPAPAGVDGIRVSERRLNFAALVQPALEEGQTRLVFLALAALRNSIEYYKPTSDELDWPKTAASKTRGVRNGPVLSGTREATAITSPAAVSVKEIDDAESMFSKQLSIKEPKSAAAGAKSWYPTLRKAIWLLRRIYRLLNSVVFDDLAHRIVHSTIQSLLYASQQVSKQRTPQDGQLFLIIHLLHLKQQIVAFDIEFSPPEVDFDFSAVTNTFYELRERGSLWNPASWVQLVSGAVGGGLLPKVVENMLDAKAELDGRLRTVINDFVNAYASHVTAPIDATGVAEAKAKNEFDALKAVRTVRGLAEKDVPVLRAKLEEFVEDARTRETLVAAVRDQVIMSYEDFFDTITEGTAKKVSRKGKGREDEVMGPALFGEAMERVFEVGQMVGQDVDSVDGNVSE